MVAKNTIQLDKELREALDRVEKLELIVKEILTLSSQYNCIGMSNAKIMLEKF